MKSRAIRTTRLACALAALGASLSAHAQYSYCIDEKPYSVAADDDISPYANGCIRTLADQRAAVLLPSALVNIERVPRDHSLRRHAWGFLDQNGRLAISPIFEAVGDFRHGMAAVKWKGKWGFIDTKGRMAVPPRYDAVQDYAEIGLTVAILDGRYLLIDRKGQPVGAPMDEGMQSLHVGAGVPALATVEYKPEYRSSTGERRYGDTGVGIIKSYGNGLYIATNKEGRYGLVDRDWKWVLEPDYQDISVPGEDGSMAVAYADGDALLLDLDGKPVGADQGYRSLMPVTKAFWSAELDRGSYVVLDSGGKPVVTLKSAEAQESQRYGDAIVYPSGGKQMALIPGRAEPLTLGADLFVAENQNGYVLFSNEERVPAGLLTPRGNWLHGDTAPAWLKDTGRMVLSQGKLWLFKQEGELLNVLDEEGRLLLKPETVEAAKSRSLKNLPLDIPGSALGLLAQDHCQCAEDGAGLLLADGGIASDPAWRNIIPLDGSDEDYGAQADAEAAGLKAEQLRYAAQTAAGLLLLDAMGKPMDLPAQQHIGPFRHGYAPAYADGVSRMLDRSGKTYDLPRDFFEAQIVAPGVVRFLKTAAEGSPWGLYDFVAGKEIAAPAFQDIGLFQDGLAVASLGQDRVGIIDLKGKWIVPPSHHSAERITAKIWKLRQAGPQQEEYERPAAVFNAEGRALTAFRPKLSVGVDSEGAIAAADDKQRWTITPDGSEAVDMEDADYVRMGDWTVLRRQPRQGYLDSQGQWRIAPSSAVAGTFRGAPARTLLTGEDGPRLIDDQGKTVTALPAGEWRWPQGSDMLLRHYYAGNREMTDYTGLDGKKRLSVEGRASAYSEGLAVTRVSNHGMRALDGKGAYASPVYDALGPLSEGLAPASMDNGYGYVDARGKLVIAADYRVVAPFSKGRAVVSTLEQSMIIDPSGKQVARVEMQCGVRTLYGSHNQRLWPLSLPSRCPR
ncbi:WG repeat-containing protein [Achromobacter xylosoxidans]|uniref:WG repeat-containing protein n=1 Tax=Alcaligenes xylosoxydans xylosoxydans TaxID=85698 RepID=UPI000B492509|nr:WG repeat-containing protein [Achromobacter xylosoxidans]